MAATKFGRLRIPVEVKSGWSDLVHQAGTHARCLFDANPLRQFAMVLAYNHNDMGLRFLVFHHGGLSSSVRLEPRSQTGRRDILRIFLAIFLGKRLHMLAFPCGVMMERCFSLTKTVLRWRRFCITVFVFMVGLHEWFWFVNPIHQKILLFPWLKALVS